jgi:predicted metal-binding membrane protein
METATLRRPPALPGAIQLGLIFGLVAFAAVGWAVTDDRMGGMDAGPGTVLGGLGWFLGVWVVMMAAMMFPSIAPMVLMFVRIQEGKRDRGQEAPAGATALFVGGYLVAWATAGLVGYAIVEGVRELDLSFLAWDEGGPYVAGGVIVAAAIYQLTPLKDVCLRHCRSPLMFLLNHSHPGRLGAMRMGVEHGGFCVGCCWMLMAALFALGVMSLGWMAFIAALIAVEKLLPWKALANRGIAVVLLVLGLGVAIASEDVPGLTEPGSAEARQAMEAMGMESGEGGMSEDEAMGGMGGEGGMSEEESMGGMSGEDAGSMGGEGAAGLEGEGAAGMGGEGGAGMDGAEMP